MNPLPPVSSLSSLQQRSLQNRLETLLIGTIKKNCNTIYFREAPLLSDLRGQLTPASAEDTSILTAFSTLVPLSTYEDYRPFVVRFLRPTPYPSHEVRDLLSPGLPLFIAQSSGTSGSEFKYFPKYTHPLFTQGQACFSRGTTQLISAALYVLGSMKTIEFEEDSAKKIPITIVTGGYMRVHYGITPANESEMASIKRKSIVSFPKRSLTVIALQPRLEWLLLLWVCSHSKQASLAIYSLLWPNDLLARSPPHLPLS